MAARAALTIDGFERPVANLVFVAEVPAQLVTAVEDALIWSTGRC